METTVYTLGWVCALEAAFPLSEYISEPAIVHRHPPVRNEGWMVGGQETVFC